MVHRYEILSILSKDLTTASFCPVACLQEYLDGIARKECACRNTFGSKELGLDFSAGFGGVFLTEPPCLLCAMALAGLAACAAAAEERRHVSPGSCFTVPHLATSPLDDSAPAGAARSGSPPQ